MLYSMNMVRLHTDTNSESKDTRSCKYVLDQVGLTGSDESGSLPVMLVIIRGSRDSGYMSAFDLVVVFGTNKGIFA